MFIVTGIVLLPVFSFNSDNVFFTYVMNVILVEEDMRADLVKVATFLLKEIFH